MSMTSTQRPLARLPSLRQAETVARGSERAVFEWEDEPTILLKLTHDHAVLRDPFGRTRDPIHSREVRAWRAALQYSARTGRPPPVAEILVLRSIDGSIVQLVRKVADAEGRMGPMLDRLIASDAFGDAELDLLNALAADLAAAGIVVYDARPANIVLEKRRDGPARFVLVDGFGDRAAIPLRALLPPLARRRLARALRRTAQETGLEFDGVRFAFPVSPCGAGRQPPTNGASAPHTSRTRASRPQASR